ncbi:MAG: VWA domain-containing protein [Phycisphaerales bacterium]|nr:VWA domain-containing protein [Phycisphaerales bacterium]
MSLSFENPSLLFLLLLALPLAMVGARWFRAMIPLRRASAVGARVVLIGLIVGMLAGARRVRETESLATIAVIDLSESVLRFGDLGPDPVGAMRAFLRQGLQGRGPDDLLGLVVFDGRAIAAAVPSRADVLERSLESPGVEGTDIAAALRYAAALLPPDATGRLVLFSDGNETTGSAATAAAELAGTSVSGRGLSIDVVPIDHMVGEEVIVESLDAPPRAAPGSTVALRVMLRSTSATRGVLQLTREGEPVDINGPEPGFGRIVDLEPGRNIALINVPLERGRVHRFEAVFVPDRRGGQFVGDMSLANNRASAFTLTPGRGSVLFVDGVSNGAATGAGATLPNVLREADVDVRVVPTEGFPEDMLDLQAYDLVMLANVPAEAMRPEQQAMLVSHVRDLGAGLVMIGGPDSFGAGGWHGSDLERILPLRLDLPDQVIVPEAALMFVLDCSGSMGASVLGSMRTQQQVANEAAALAIQSLDKTDLIGVIAFNDSYRTVVPLGPNTNPEHTAARVRSIAAGGGTTLGPAVRAAAEQLSDHEAKTRQIIILSDGRSTDSDTLEELGAEVAQRGIRVTAIAVGDAADTQTLERMALAGGGAFYNVINPSMLPRIFLKAVRVVRSPLIREGLLKPSVSDAGSPLAVGMEDAPPLLGLVMSRFREEPNVVNAMVASSGDPLLSHWNVGLGQVVAFTSDAHQWAARWIDWPGYRTFWTRVARSTTRVPRESSSELRAEVGAGTLSLELDALDSGGHPVDLLDVPVTVYRPGGQAVPVRLEQVGPGRYAGSVPAAEPGAYIVIARPRQGATRLAPLLTGVTVPQGSELSTIEPNRALMLQISELTGGRVLAIGQPQAGVLFDRHRLQPWRSSTPIWPTLMAWALIVYLLDVGTRRVAWDRFVSSSFGADLRREIRESVKMRSVTSTGTLLERVRTRKPADGTPAALGQADANRLAEEARQRRREAYEAGRRALRRQPESGSAPSGAASQPGSDDSRLLAAKRRAQQRISEQTDER